MRAHWVARDGEEEEEDAADAQGVWLCTIRKRPPSVATALPRHCRTCDANASKVVTSVDDEDEEEKEGCHEDEDDEDAATAGASLGECACHADTGAAAA